MKILHTIESMEPRYGGIATCTFDLLTALQQSEEEVKLLAPRPPVADAHCLGDGEKWLSLCDNDGVGPFNYSRNAVKAIENCDADVYHVNGLWQHINHATCKIARRRGKPYIITPHGMLYEQALKISYWKKWPMLKLWFHKDIMKATCLHVTCNQEMEQVRAFGYTGAVAVIGNPVRITSEIDCVYNSRKVFESSDKNNGRDECHSLGFLGRLHPRKKAEQLLQGLALCKDVDAEVVIMGSGDAEYETFLKEEARRLGIVDKVRFLGFVSGKQKYEELAKLSALFVPSDMENFGMIVPEALLVGTPVMASLGTPWNALNDYGCGWWRDNTPESIAAVIKEITSKSPAELFEMGQRGRRMVIENYHSSIIASKMVELYRWLAGMTSKPDFVYD